MPEHKLHKGRTKSIPCAPGPKGTHTHIWQRRSVSVKRKPQHQQNFHASRAGAGGLRIPLPPVLGFRDISHTGTLSAGASLGGRTRCRGHVYMVSQRDRQTLLVTRGTSSSRHRAGLTPPHFTHGQREPLLCCRNWPRLPRCSDTKPGPPDSHSGAPLATRPRPPNDNLCRVSLKSQDSSADVPCLSRSFPGRSGHGISVLTD